LSQSQGIGHETISKTIAEYRRTNTVTSPNKKRNTSSLFDKIDDLVRNRLRQKVHSFWLRRELPTIDKILITVNEDPSLPNCKRTTLYSTIKKLDFVFEKRKRCNVLTEREDLIVWRRNYFYNIRKYRQEGRQIYYLDETWLNAGDCVEGQYCSFQTRRVQQRTNDRVDQPNWQGQAANNTPYWFGKRFFARWFIML